MPYMSFISQPFQRTALLATAIAAICLATASGCRAPGRKPAEILSLQMVYRSSCCRLCPEKPSAVWLSTIQQARSATGRPISLPASKTAGNPGFVLICMGRQPTGGYSILPASSTFYVQDGVAMLDLIWQKPGPNTYVTLALTCPCLLLALEKGSYNTIRVRDQNGMTRFVIRPAWSGRTPPVSGKEKPF